MKKTSIQTPSNSTQTPLTRKQTATQTPPNSCLSTTKLKTQSI